MMSEIKDSNVEPGVRTARFLPGEYLPRFYEPHGLALQDSEATVRAFENSDGSQSYQMEFAHPPLGHDGFFKLLATTAPYKIEQNPRDVLADWSIREVVEREKDERTREQTPEYNEWLAGVLKYHENFGSAWHDFVDDSLEVFRGVLKDYDSSMWVDKDEGIFIHSSDVHPSFVPVTKLSTRRIAALFTAQHTPQTVAEFARELNGDTGLEVTETDVITYLRRSMSHSSAMRRNKRSGDRAVSRIFEETSPGKRATYVQGALLQLPPEQRGIFEAWVLRHHPSVFAAEDGEQYVFDPVGKQRPLNEVLAEAKQVKGWRHTATIVPLSGGKGRRVWSVLPGSARLQTTPFQLVPQVAWRHGVDGSRTLELGVEQHPEQANTFRDRMLGFLTVAYLQSQLRNGWKSTWPNPRVPSRPQGIGVAQIPSFVLMPKYKQQLLDSELIDVAELAIAYA